MIRLKPEELPALTQFIYSLCSIALDSSKGYLIEGRLGPIAEAAGCRSFLELMERTNSDGSGTLRRKIIDEITTQETYFFRDSTPFDLLRFKLIPDLMDRRSRSGSTQPLRIWSAACSTGQEICSIAIVLREVLGELGCQNIRLVGTDISDQAVAKASAGIFSPLEVARGLGESSRDRFFVPDHKGWKIRDELRSMMSFRKMNLTGDLSAVGTFDLIFCRNVAIYFNEQDRISLFQRIEKRLEPEGCLVLGSMESLIGICPRLESKRHQRAVYYQLAAGGEVDRGLAALAEAVSPPTSKSAPQPGTAVVFPGLRRK